MRLDLRKLELRVVRIHLPDLFSGRGAQNLDDLDQLIHARIAREYRLAQQQLGQNAAGAPNVYLGRVVDRSKNQFWGSERKKNKTTASGVTSSSSTCSNGYRCRRRLVRPSPDALHFQNRTALKRRSPGPIGGFGVLCLCDIFLASVCTPAIETAGTCITENKQDNKYKSATVWKEFLHLQTVSKPINRKRKITVISCIKK